MIWCLHMRIQRFMVEETGVWFISLGTNDGGSLWVNGLNIWDYKQAQGYFC